MEEMQDNNFIEVKSCELEKLISENSELKVFLDLDGKVKNEIIEELNLGKIIVISVNEFSQSVHNHKIGSRIPRMLNNQNYAISITNNEVNNENKEKNESLPGQFDFKQHRDLKYKKQIHDNVKNDLNKKLSRRGEKKKFYQQIAAEWEYVDKDGNRDTTQVSKVLAGTQGSILSEDILCNCQLKIPPHSHLKLPHLKFPFKGIFI
ncbi:hypothetical protein ACE1TI_16380 [Alteribacillus sp. JSM 102045]|uniref:hypothetical protein n=1 Tax=Alteribacillus sp. JSM 102045 TaxID=1562101 RepID=UPI0035C0B9CB